MQTAIYNTFASGEISNLSDNELIYSVIGSETVANNLINHFDNDLSRLFKCSFAELKSISGIGDKKAASILGILELTRRRTRIEKKVSNIQSSKDVFDLIYPDLADLDHEELYFIAVNNANKVILKKRLSVGGRSETAIDVALLFKQLLSVSASGVILAHNHPSGTLSPSQADTVLTTRINEASKLLNIKLLDHLIIGNSAFYSFADEGII